MIYFFFDLIDKVFNGRLDSIVTLVNCIQYRDRCSTCTSVGSNAANSSQGNAFACSVICALRSNRVQHWQTDGQRVAESCAESFGVAGSSEPLVEQTC